jgi:hypothetical protein
MNWRSHRDLTVPVPVAPPNFKEHLSAVGLYERFFDRNILYEPP